MNANSNDSAQLRQFPPLETLVATIDRKLGQVPSPYAIEGFAPFMGSDGQAQNQQGQHYIRFLINNTAFALPLQNALEIDYVPEITPLPNLPQWVLGICNLRGDIVSVIDLEQILKITRQDKGAAKKLLQIRNQDTSTAIMVDKVASMQHAENQDNQVDNDTMENKAFSPFVHEVFDLDGLPVHLLDVDALMAAIEL